ncbi:30S ribosomal protein S6 [Candidatus Kaiserbacteria bacterium]|nr:30S ribosomal protein S6 [Candidatus Kaiserbacteria bacterium]
MSETTMPAAEAVAVTDERELFGYELAFHVLPTVAEGEVSEVISKLKNKITKIGGEIFDEEEAKRFDLAYEIVKHMEGRNRKFTSAYFGWVRFHLESSKVEELTEAVEEEKNILRHLLVKLTKDEEAHPFRFHEALDIKKVETVDAIPADSDDEDEDEEEVEVEESIAIDANLDETTKKDDA